MKYFKMKTSHWIWLIGALCIVIGFLWLTLNIYDLLVPEMTITPEANRPEIPANLLIWKMVLPYTGVLVNIVYLLAGIFFLIKKPFSVKLMYIALTFSILYEIIPLLFLNKYDLPYFHYQFNVFNLIGPCFYAVLLIGVLIISKDYYKPKEEITRPRAENALKLILLLSGYVLLILSSAFLNVELISLLAMPLYIVSIVIILSCYLGLINKESSKREFAKSLIIPGTVILAIIVALPPLTFIDYLQDHSGSGVVNFSFSHLFLIGINIVLSSVIFVGLKRGSNLNNKRLIIAVLPSLLVIPSALMLIQLLNLHQLGI